MREIARQSGVDDKTVALCLAKAGLKHGRGGHDLDDALQAVADHADLLRGSGQDAGRSMADASSAREQLASAKITTVELTNQKLRIENQVREGQLVERAAVEATAIDIISNAKAALLALKYKLAPLVAVETDIAIIHKIIGDGVVAALSELADIDRFTAAVLD